MDARFAQKIHQGFGKHFLSRGVFKSGNTNDVLSISCYICNSFRIKLHPFQHVFNKVPKIRAAGKVRCSRDIQHDCTPCCGIHFCCEKYIFHL